MRDQIFRFYIILGGRTIWGRDCFSKTTSELLKKRVSREGGTRGVNIRGAVGDINRAKRGGTISGLWKEFPEMKERENSFWEGIGNMLEKWTPLRCHTPKGGISSRGR